MNNQSWVSASDHLPEAAKHLIEEIARRKTLPSEQKPTPQQLNDKRNAIVAELVALPPPNPEYVPISAEEKEKRRQAILSRLAANG